MTHERSLVPSGSEDDTLGRPITRRRALLATGAVGATALAGCLDDGGDEDSGATAGLPPCTGDQYDPPDQALEGESTAPVTVEIFEDYSCPACAALNASVLPGVREDYVASGDVALYRREFPIPIDDWSWRVPHVARLVQRDVGADAYHAFADAAFANQGEYDEDLVASLASDEGLDADAAREAMDERPFCSFLREEREEGIERGVEATPTVFVGDERLTGPSEEELRDAIDRAL